MVAAPTTSVSWSARVYYGWPVLLVAAAAMVGTLPGRTQGLGLITEPLRSELGLSRVTYAQLNFWATIIGAGGAIGIGRAIDFFGSRVVLTMVALALGPVVVVMSRTQGPVNLAMWLTLSRALGQSALSVVALAIVGHWFVRRIDTAMAVFTVVMSIGFMLAFPTVGWLVQTRGWRAAWLSIGVTLPVVLASSAWLIVRRSPDSCGFEPDGALSSTSHPLSGYRWNDALRTPAGNGLGGWLAGRVPLLTLLSISLAVLAAGVLALPFVTALAHVMGWAVAMGLGGGLIMVLFFSVWPRVFGRRDLSAIEGAAQALTVLASALGPLLLAWCVDWTGSYQRICFPLATVIGLVAAASMFVRLPESAA